MVIDTESVQAAIRDVAEANGARLAPLFGSYARGTATRRSDVDVIFVEQTSARFLDRLAKYFDPLSERLAAPVEVFVYTPDEFRRMRDGFFLRRALSEGITVYEHGKL
jgi:predicted nucleotidyltransferase